MHLLHNLVPTPQGTRKEDLPAATEVLPQANMVVLQAIMAVLLRVSMEALHPDSMAGIH